MSADQLRRAYDLIRQGQKEEAVAILQPILRSERDNADAWWLMANALTDPARQIQALNQVLRLRPSDQRAQKMLARLEAEQRSKEDAFSFPVSDDDPFANASRSSNDIFPNSSSRADLSGSDPFASNAPPVGSGDPFASSSDPFSQGAQQPRPTYATFEPPRQQRGRNPFVTCLAIVGALVIGCCAFTFFVLPRVAGPIVEQVASQFPELIGSLTANPELQSVFATLGAEGFEFNGSTNAAFNPSDAQDRGKIEIDRPLTGNVDTFDDDFYTLAVNDRQSLTIEVNATPGSDVDPQLYVYDASYNLVAENDDISLSDNNFNSRLTVTLAPGAYYIVISAFGSGGAYEVSVTR